MAGILSTTIRQTPSPRDEEDEGQTIVIGGDEPSTPDSPSGVVNFPDGSVVVYQNAGDKTKKSLDPEKFDENLAEALGESYLGTLADELLRAIEEDERSRQDWLEERAEGVKLLALKIEKPSSSGSGSAAGVDNTSRSRNTLLLEACLRFQATASGELLPTDGPVKVENKLSRDTMEGDDLAQLLEDDFNFYLTDTASEYVPDTERMLLWVAAGGSGFKKVYRCPIRRRPVSESVDAANICVSNAATDLANADRVTFTSPMRQSVMKRMQHLGVYRDAALGYPTMPSLNSVDEQKAEITGVTVSNRPEDIPYTILECYAQIEVEGDEHIEDKKLTGLPRPYKVTIEKDSRTILEIRRNWRQDDEMEKRREVFVKFPFVPGFGFYDIGLFQIAGNPTVAATALLRIMIDSGIYANFPGGLVAKGTNRQNTTDLSPPPGGFAPVDVSSNPDGDIRKAVMPLPYKMFDSALFQLYEEVVSSGQRVAGIPDMAVGEGKQDAPVGTTIALIEQAIKVTDSVHKRLHTAQGREFQLLRDLFREHPEDFWRFNQDRDSNWDKEKLLKALNDYNLVPRADPNTSTHIQRILRAQAVYQMAKADPGNFQIMQVYDYVLRTIGVQNPQSILSVNPGGAPPDPKALAAQASAEAAKTKAGAAMLDATTKAKTAQADLAQKSQESQNDVEIQRMESADAQLRAKTDLVKAAGDRRADALSQASKQLHERQMHAHDLASEHVQQARGIASDHIQQFRDLTASQDKLVERSSGGRVDSEQEEKKPPRRRKRVYTVLRDEHGKITKLESADDEEDDLIIEFA